MPVTCSRRPDETGLGAEETGMLMQRGMGVNIFNIIYIFYSRFFLLR